MSFDLSGIDLTPKQKQVFDALVEAYPGIATKQDIYDKCYGDISLDKYPWKKPRLDAVDHHIARVKRKLSTIGLVVTSKRHKGWCLEFDGGAT